MNQVPDAPFVLNLLLAAVLIGNAVAIWLGIANGKKIQRREVSFSETPASKREFDAHASECRLERAALRAEIKADRDANQVHASARSQTIFTQIEKVRVELMDKNDELRQEMQRNFQDTERALGRIEGKIDQGKS